MKSGAIQGPRFNRIRVLTGRVMAGFDCTFIYVQSFSNMNLTELSKTVFNKLSNLESLNLSKNSIKTLPDELGLDKLKKLDISENKLDSLEFVSQFPVLEELWIEGNGLDVSVSRNYIYQ
jgi:Leucine-rich repeat (LRR) protein